MSSQSPFTDRTPVVSGGSRGVGLVIALGAARRAANVELLAESGVADLSCYGGGKSPILDTFVDKS